MICLFIEVLHFKNNLIIIMKYRFHCSRNRLVKIIFFFKIIWYTYIYWENKFYRLTKLFFGTGLKKVNLKISLVQKISKFFSKEGNFFLNFVFTTFPTVTSHFGKCFFRQLFSAMQAKKICTLYKAHVCKNNFLKNEEVGRVWHRHKDR